MLRGNIQKLFQQREGGLSYEGQAIWNIYVLAKC